MTVLERKGRRLDPAKLSVLIIDDQPFYRTLLTEVMKNIGVRKIAVAADGLDALDALEDFTPSFIICDWVMPEMDGLEFTKRLRKIRDEQLRMLPIIMVTSNNLKSQIEEARNAGVDTFILKPVSAKSVWDRMKEVIETPRDFVVSPNYIGPCRRARKANTSYSGPYRRSDDPMEVNVGFQAEARAKDTMGLIAKDLALLVNKMRSGNLSVIPAIVAETQKVMALAQKIDDNQLSKVCWSLNTYLEKFAAAGKVRVDIVTTHLESMEVLIKTPCAEGLIRDELVKGLHSVVMRALRAA